MRTTPDPYRGFRFPAEIISHAVWLYHCFGLSLREVETILAERGVVVSHESIRAWGLRFGRAFATTLKRRRPRPGDKWHLDEVFIRIRGKLHYYSPVNMPDTSSCYVFDTMQEKRSLRVRGYPGRLVPLAGGRPARYRA